MVLWVKKESNSISFYKAMLFLCLLLRFAAQQGVVSMGQVGIEETFI